MSAPSVLWTLKPSNHPAFNPTVYCWQVQLYLLEGVLTHTIVVVNDLNSIAQTMGA